MPDMLKAQLQKDKSIEDILEKYDWRKFESIIGEIFRENGFCTWQNFRFKTRRRYEIDIIAVKESKLFCIDCKWWGRGRYKKSGLRQAVNFQENRVKELQKFLKRNFIAKNMLRIAENYSVYPLIVTLHEEDTIKENETFVIPVWKLNSFLIEFNY